MVEKFFFPDPKDINIDNLPPRRLDRIRQKYGCSNQALEDAIFCYSVEPKDIALAFVLTGLVGFPIDEYIDEWFLIHMPEHYFFETDDC